MVKMSMLVLEFFAAINGTERIQALQYKLCIRGIPIDGPTNMFCDNEAVVSYSTLLESTLKNKHIAICYHCIQEACALGMIQIVKGDGATNLTDLLTKYLTGPLLRDVMG